jgi:hypothetical protein
MIPMKRLLHRSLAVVAVMMHLAAPVAAYGMARGDAPANDVCSAARTPVAPPGSGGAPLPATGEHHCANAPCCSGGAVGAAAPPLVSPFFLHIASGREAPPVLDASAAPVPPIAAAQPRGPPLPA